MPFNLLRTWFVLRSHSNACKHQILNDKIVSEHNSITKVRPIFIRECDVWAEVVKNMFMLQISVVCAGWCDVSAWVFFMCVWFHICMTWQSATCRCKLCWIVSWSWLVVERTNTRAHTAWTIFIEASQRFSWISSTKACHHCYVVGAVSCEREFVCAVNGQSIPWQMTIVPAFRSHTDTARPSVTLIQQHLFYYHFSRCLVYFHGLYACVCELNIMLIWHGMCGMWIVATCHKMSR